MIGSLKLLSALGLALFVELAAADTCSEIEAVAPSIEVVYRFHPTYTITNSEYWSTSCAALKPSCIIYPSSAEDVAAIVDVLRDGNNKESFAVKSGGHNPNNYWSSIDGGPLISTEKLNHVRLDRDTGIVRMGPGLRWDELAEQLDGSGYSAVGGRIGNVGVGGYMLGGGLSFMSQEYGWAASSVLEFEIVLANGTVTTASSRKNADLFKALKGGGNNFGIVTSFTIQTYQQGEVYGGVVVFPRLSQDTDDQMLSAIRDFTKFNDDDKAAVIPTAEYTSGGIIDMWIVFMYYNGKQPPAHVFKNFTNIKHTIDTRKTRRFAEFVSHNNWAVIKGSVYLIGTETIPLPQDTSSSAWTDMLPEVHSHWRNTTKTVDHLAGFIGSIAYQPLPRSVARIAQENGGDLMDFDDGADLIVIELNYSFWGQGDYETGSEGLRRTYGGIRERVVRWQEEGQLEDTYVPLFSNDAFHEQDYYGRLRPENAALARSLVEELDPEGLFSDRTGGWKP